jgi:TetR/AcrR family transcriptional regulator, transcriptional repressor for nem operon
VYVKFDIIVNDDLRLAMVGVRQFDESDVLEKALEVFWRQGLHATSMLDLAHASGVQRGSLYNAYGGKEEMFLRAFEIYAERFLNNVRKALDDPDPKRALQAFFKVAIANMTVGSPARGCLTTKTATELDRNEPRIQERLRRLLDDLEDIVRTALSSAQARKKMALPPAQAAQVIVTFTRGLAVMERVHQDPNRLNEGAAALIRALTG